MFSHRQAQLAVGTISLLLAMLLFGQSADAARPLAIRVLSYNIHHGEGVDGKLDLQRIARVITSVKPDLVALQELDRNTTRTEKVDQPAVLALDQDAGPV